MAATVSWDRLRHCAGASCAGTPHVRRSTPRALGVLVFGSTCVFSTSCVPCVSKLLHFHHTRVALRCWLPVGFLAFFSFSPFLPACLVSVARSCPPFLIKDDFDTSTSPGTQGTSRARVLQRVLSRFCL
eukprot:2081395-Rhodomonas_salina.1